MRIIAYPGESAPWKAIFGCEHCGAVLEVEEKDLSTKNRGIAGKTFEPVLLFSCMYCGKWKEGEVTERFCLHEGVMKAPIGFIHSHRISCDWATVFFRVADKIWRRICARYGRGEIEFWVLLYRDPESPIIASCSGNSVFFNFGRLRTNLTLEQDVASRLIEELYHLHEWWVQGVEPDVPDQYEKIVLTPEELVVYYSLDHKYRALRVLAEMTNIAYWEGLLAKVEAHRASQGL